MSKNVMNGGYTAQEARNLLLIRGIEHVKGIIPHKAPKNENLGEFDSTPHLELLPTKKCLYFDRIWICRLECRCNKHLCWRCACQINDVIEHFYGETIHVYPLWDTGAACYFCGDVSNGEFPF